MDARLGGLFEDNRSFGRPIVLGSVLQEGGDQLVEPFRIKQITRMQRQDRSSPAVKLGSVIDDSGDHIVTTSLKEGHKRTG
jgi:hypothetical protein